MKEKKRMSKSEIREGQRRESERERVQKLFFCAQILESVTSRLNEAWKKIPKFNKSSHGGNWEQSKS